MSGEISRFLEDDISLITDKANDLECISVPDYNECIFPGNVLIM